MFLHVFFFFFVVADKKMWWSLLLLLALVLTIVSLSITLVQTSQSTIDQRVTSALTANNDIVKEMKRLIDVHSAVKPVNTVVQLAAVADTPLENQNTLIVDSVVVQDQELVLLPVQTTATESGVYRYSKADSMLVLEPHQPAMGSLLSVTEGQMFRDHMFLRTRTGFQSLAKSLLVNPYQVLTRGVLSYDADLPTGVSLHATPALGHTVERIPGIKTLASTDSNHVFIMATSSEARIADCIDGTVFHFLTDGACAVVFQTANLHVNGTNYTKLVGSAADQSCSVVFDETSTKWRLLFNQGFALAL
jgi:hypothetical protein